MGMGEPLLNFANVVKATDLMQEIWLSAFPSAGSR